jgi:hypothetical protein
MPPPAGGGNGDSQNAVEVPFSLNSCFTTVPLEDAYQPLPAVTHRPTPSPVTGAPAPLTARPSVPTSTRMPRSSTSAPRPPRTSEPTTANPPTVPFNLPPMNTRVPTIVPTSSTQAPTHVTPTASNAPRRPTQPPPTSELTTRQPVIDTLTSTVAEVSSAPPKNLGNGGEGDGSQPVSAPIPPQPNSLSGKGAAKTTFVQQYGWTVGLTIAFVLLLIGFIATARQISTRMARSAYRSIRYDDEEEEGDEQDNGGADDSEENEKGKGKERTSSNRHGKRSSRNGALEWDAEEEDTTTAERKPKTTSISSSSSSSSSSLRVEPTTQRIDEECELQPVPETHQLHDP